MAVLYAAESAGFLYLLRATELTRGNLSSHLTRLEKAEYLTIKKVFEGKVPRTICRLSEKGRLAFEAYRAQKKSAMDQV